MNKLWSACGAVVAAFVVAGCGSAPATSSSSTSSESPQQSSEERTYAQTVVVLHGDGMPTVTQYTITHEEALAHQAALMARTANPTGRVPETLNDVTACQGYYTLADLFDEEYFLGNEICFKNDGSSADYAYLPNYARGTSGLWDGKYVLSWATGTEYTAINNDNGEGGPGSHCVPFGTNNNNFAVGSGGYAGCIVIGGRRQCYDMNYLWMEPVGQTFSCG